MIFGCCCKLFRTAVEITVLLLSTMQLPVGLRRSIRRKDVGTLGPGCASKNALCCYLPGDAKLPALGTCNT
eukprot:17653-Heterococcus_DN1.PRE.4